MSSTDPNSKEGMEPLITIAATKQLVDEMVPMGRTFNVYEVERALGMMRGTYESERRADKARIKELEGLAKELIAALKHRLEGTREDCSDELSSFGEPQLSINHGWQVLAKAAELIPSNT